MISTDLYESLMCMCTLKPKTLLVVIKIKKTYQVERNLSFFH